MTGRNISDAEALQILGMPSEPSKKTGPLNDNDALRILGLPPEDLPPAVAEPAAYNPPDRQRGSFRSQVTKAFEANPITEPAETQVDPSVSSISKMYMGDDFTAGNRASMLFGLPFAKTPQGRENIIRENVKGAKFGEDIYGQKIFTTPDEKKYYVDHPGLSSQTLTDLTGQVAVAAPLATVAGLAPPSVPIAMAAQGLAGVGTNLIGQALSKFSGSGEDLNVIDPVIEGGISAAVPLASRILKSRASPFYEPGMIDASRGVKKQIQKKGVEPEFKEYSGFNSPADMAIDTDVGLNIAAGAIVADKHSPSAQYIIRQVNRRDAAAPARIERDVNSAFGELTDTQRGIQAALNSDKAEASKAYKIAIENAGPVDTSDLVKKIDSLIEKAPKNTSERALLENLRKSIVLEEGAGPTFAKGPNGVPILNKESMIPGKPPVYLSDAEQLDKIRKEFDHNIRFGDGDKIRPGAISPSDATAKLVRTELSGAIKKSSQEYADVMNRYSGIYKAEEVNELAAKVLGGGASQLKPEQVAAIMADPELSETLRVAVRSIIRDKIGQSPNDISALRNLTKTDYTRNNLNIVFNENPKAIDDILRTADRESHYADVSRTIKAASRKYAADLGSKIAESSDRPLLINPIQQAQQLAAVPPNYLSKILQGTSGPRYQFSLGPYLTKPTPEIVSELASQRRKNLDVRALNVLGGVGANLNPSVALEPKESKRKQRIDAERKAVLDERAIAGSQARALAQAKTKAEVEARANAQASGGRIQRASGGRAGMNHVTRAAMLIRAAERAKNQHGDNTESLLNQPDESIAKALKVANSAI